MTLKALSLAGLGVIGAGAVSVGGYAISTRAGTSASAEEQDEARDQRLLSSDHTFSSPKFTSYGKVSQGCYENLNQNANEEQEFESGKLYGCGVARMDIWDSGNQFGNEKVNYLTFESEIFLIEEDEAWRINTLIDNHSGSLIYRYLLSYLTQEGDNSWSEDEAFLIIEKVPKQDQKSIKQKGGKQFSVSVGTKELNIKLPGTDESWFKKTNYLVDSSASQGNPLTKINKKTKEWSGIWIENSKKQGQGIFQDIEVFIEKKENSQVFCEKGKCGSGVREKYQISYSGTSGLIPNNWDKAYATLKNNSIPLNSENFDNYEGPTIAILDLIDNSKGKWSDSKEICDSKNTTINPEELKNLKMFCSYKQD